MAARNTVFMILFSLALTGCFQPPFNNFERERREVKQISESAVIGGGAGALAGALAGSTGIGLVVGVLAGGAYGASKTTKQAILNELQRQDILIHEYGNTISMIIPTDRYFLFNSAQLNDICFRGLVNIIRLMRYYPCRIIYVAGFTDNVGSRHHKQMLSQAQAETMLTFLWANNINAKRLHAEGYADKHAIGDNNTIRGSAYNRRIELQWYKGQATCTPHSPPYDGAMK